MRVPLMALVLASMIIVQPHPVLAEAVAVELPGDGAALLAWVRGEDVHLTLLTLPAKLDLPAGQGCMVLARAGVPVRWLELSLPDDLARLASLLETPLGALVEGTVSTYDLVAFPPTVRIAPFENQPPVECRLGIEELGVWQTQVDRQGRFELGPVTPGWWKVSVSARSHGPAERIVSIGPTIELMKLGLIEVPPGTLVVVEVDTRWEEPPFNLRVEREQRSPEGAQSFTEVANLHLETATRVLPLRPGKHRFHLTRPDTDLGLSVDEEFGIGEHHLVLRPTPFTVAGRILREGRGVAGVELAFHQKGHRLELTSGSRGEFHLHLWIPEMYMIEARTPEGETEVFLLDAREAEAGEELTREFELAEGFVSGSVVDAATGTPLAEAKVTVFQEGGGRVFATDNQVSDDGSFRLPLKSDMNVRLTAWNTGYMPREENLGLERPSTHLILAMERGLEISGRLVGPHGGPLPGRVLGVLSGALNQSVCSSQAGPDGHFSLTCPTGTMLFGLSPGHPLGWVPAREGELVLPVGAGQPITVVTAQLPDGRPATGALVTIRTVDGFEVPMQVFGQAQQSDGHRPRADGDGAIAVSSLPPGIYTFVLVRRAGPTMPLGTVTLPSPTPVTLTLPSLPPG